MKVLKFCIILIALASLNIASLNANQIANNKLQQVDSKFLFGDEKVDVYILSNEEMMETKGEFLGPLLGGIIFGLGSWAFNRYILKNKHAPIKFNFKYPLP